LVCCTIAVVLGILIGFLFWVTAAGLNGYIICWVVILLVFIAIVIVLFYLGGKDRIRLEKELIEENQRRQA
jgi:hypothetical protein